MANQTDIQLYISFMSEEDPSLRAEAQQALHDYGDSALLDLAAELTVLRQGANAPVVDAVLQTMERIGTKRAIELITFLAGSSAAEGLWPPDVCQRAQTALATLGQAVPASDTPLSDMAIRTLLFLLGSDDAETRQRAREILLHNTTQVNPLYYAEALTSLDLVRANAGNPYTEKNRLETRLYQDQHPRPDEILSILRAIDPQGAILQTLTTAGSRTARDCTPEIRSLALETAIALGIDTSAWELFEQGAYEEETQAVHERYDAQRASRCFICGKPVKAGTDLRLGHTVFCSETCYNQAKHDPSLLM